MPKREYERDEELATESREQLEEPPLYRVLLHNDDYTTMEFVIYVLRTVFRREEADAVRTMLQVHLEGIGVAGVYPYEVAEMKVETVLRLALEHEYPLLCTLEPE